MTATVCTCIRHERDARQIAVPDPTCPHGTTQAAGIAATPLALIAMPTPKEKP